MESLNLKKLLNQFLDWQITFILHCSKDLLTGLLKRFLKFKENVPKYGRTTKNPLLCTVGTICLATYNLSKNVLILVSKKIVLKYLRMRRKIKKNNLIVFAQLELRPGFYTVILRYIKRSLATLQNLELFYQQ